MHENSIFTNCTIGETVPISLVILNAITDVVATQIKELKIKWILYNATLEDKSLVDFIGLDELIKQMKEQDVKLVISRLNEEVFCRKFIKSSKITKKIDYKLLTVITEDERRVKSYVPQVEGLVEFEGVRINFDNISEDVKAIMGNPKIRNSKSESYILIESFRSMWDDGQWPSNFFIKLNNSCSSGFWTVMAYFYFTISASILTYNIGRTSGNFDFVDFCNCCMYYATSSRSWVKIIFLIKRERINDMWFFKILDMMLSLSLIVPIVFELVPLPVLIVTSAWPYLYLVVGSFIVAAPIIKFKNPENNSLTTLLLYPSIVFSVMFINSGFTYYVQGNYIESMFKPFSDRSTVRDYFSNELNYLMTI